MRCSWKVRRVNCSEMRTGAKQLSHSSVPHNYPQSCLLRRHCCIVVCVTQSFVFGLLQNNIVIKQKLEWVKPLISRPWWFVSGLESKGFRAKAMICMQRSRVQAMIYVYWLVLFWSLISQKFSKILKNYWYWWEIVERPPKEIKSTK